jgi:Na+/proline symporter
MLFLFFSCFISIIVFIQRYLKRKNININTSILDCLNEAFDDDCVTLLVIVDGIVFPHIFDALQLKLAHWKLYVAVHVTPTAFNGKHVTVG